MAHYSDGSRISHTGGAIPEFIIILFLFIYFIIIIAKKTIKMKEVGLASVRPWMQHPPPFISQSPWSKFFHFHAVRQNICKIIGFWKLAHPPQENSVSDTESIKYLRSYRKSYLGKQQRLNLDLNKNVLCENAGQ